MFSILDQVESKFSLLHTILFFSTICRSWSPFTLQLPLPTPCYILSCERCALKIKLLGLHSKAGGQSDGNGTAFLL